ncbi:hypothetical protein SAMN04487819_105281 [Actinopolyspora alba]|uniref:Uncharacterized protein n=1 Tax=Actinopolyspora alba TaxID=673379 RepID=A0A1I1WIG2_9ACTN|nr:hypothetical protein [Actinopolyspora alba]SFD94761.1 hypothetical protein SAMN04487819_105281 [Actinopolyspora alba]
MLDEIRAQLQQITDTAPTDELQIVRTELDELRGKLNQVAGTSNDNDVQQAIRLFGAAHEKTDEATQTAMRASEHVREYAAAL